jgi:hypothetical protein
MVRTPARRRAVTRSAPWVGLVVAMLLLAVAVVVPHLTGWQVHARSDTTGSVPPLHGRWDPRPIGPRTLPALVLALLGWRYAVGWSDRAPWARLLAGSYVAALAWLLALAFMDGSPGISGVLGNEHEYLGTARAVTDVHALLEGFVDRVPKSHADHWTTHVAGHPPGALLFFVGLARVGLGGDVAAGLVVTVLAAGTGPAVLTAVRALGAEQAARRAAPFLVLGPAAVFMAVSADAVFTVVAACAVATLALAATADRPAAAAGWSVPAGLLLGVCLVLSYGLSLLAPLALAVLAAARCWRPLLVAGASAAAVLLAFAVSGFVWWQGLAALRARYWDGIAADRPSAYWLWGNLAALLLSAGPVLAAGLARLVTRWRSADRVVTLLVGAAAVSVLLADLSGMSKAEVERIWLPFVPWLLLSTALLPDTWRRRGLALQLATALTVETLLYTSW